MRTFDAIVIGSGQAGPALTARLTGAGMSVAFIEREHFGGTCVNDGCIPTKTLVASAQTARVARRAGDYGVRIAGTIDVDMKAVRARKDAISDSSRSSVEKWLRGMQGCTIFWGSARFTGPKQIAVNGEDLTADKIFINVGGRPTVPPIPGLDQVPYLNNTSMMQVDFLPEHLVILGGSYIGLEFAQMYRRFGSAVTLIEALPRLVPREDEDISAEVAKFWSRRGSRSMSAPKHCRSPATEPGSRLRSRHQADAGRSGALICSSPSDAVPTPMVSVSTRPVSKSMRAATSRSTISCEPAPQVSGRSEIATDAAHLRIRPTTIMKSSPLTCSITIRGA